MKRKFTAFLLLLSMLTLLIPAASFGATADVDNAKGELTIQKIFSGLDNDAEKPGQITVDIYDSEGDLYYTVGLTERGNYSTSITVDEGSYRIVERESTAAIAGYDLVSTLYSEDAGDEADIALREGAFSISEGETATVKIDNTYEPKDGTSNNNGTDVDTDGDNDPVSVPVSVSKHIVIEDEDLGENEYVDIPEEASFDFTITDASGKRVGTITVENYGDDYGSAEQTFTLVPNGTYYITETGENLGNDDYALDSTVFEVGENDKGQSDRASFTVDENGSYVGITATNTYKKDDGSNNNNNNENNNGTGTNNGDGTTGLNFEVPEIFSEEHDAYISGYPDGTVRPYGNITRAEVANILYRLLKPEVRTQYMTTSNSFSDVSDGEWFNTAVSTVSKMGVISGYPDGTFRPNNPITRAELAALADRFFEDSLSSDSVAFTDISSHWARKEIISAATRGLVSGYTDNSFRPNNYMSRAEAVTLINRITHRMPQTAADLMTGMTTFPDNSDTTQWYYLAIQEAANGHDYQRRDTGYEGWTALK